MAKKKVPFEIEVDPRIFGKKGRERAVEPKLALSLDLGTNCGFAYTWFNPYKKFNPEDLQIYAGILDLSSKSYESGAIRFARLRQMLAELKPDAIAYEDVKFTPAMQQGMTVAAVMARTAKSAELLGAFRGVVSEYAETSDIPCQPYPIGTIKKRATRRGNANKMDMIAAANEYYGTELHPEGKDGDDNVADALWILTLFLEEFNSGLG